MVVRQRIIFDNILRIGETFLKKSLFFLQRNAMRFNNSIGYSYRLHESTRRLYTRNDVCERTPESQWQLLSKHADVKPGFDAARCCVEKMKRIICGCGCCSWAWDKNVVGIVAGGYVVQQFCFEIDEFVDILNFEFVDSDELPVTVAIVVIAVANAFATDSDVFALAVHAYVLCGPPLWLPLFWNGNGSSIYRSF